MMKKKLRGTMSTPWHVPSIHVLFQLTACRSLWTVFACRRGVTDPGLARHSLLHPKANLDIAQQPEDGAAG